MIAFAKNLRSPTLLHDVARSLVHRRLMGLQTARLTMVDDEGSTTFGPASAAEHATIYVHNPSVYSRIAADGSVGAGEAYVDGAWHADDLVLAMRIVAREAGTISVVDGTGPRFTLANDLVRHALRRNSRGGSRKNISAHYDLGNDFFAAFLDETMMYSAGIFEQPGATMAEASHAKLRRIAAKLRLTSSDHLLEIGTGWGGMAIHAAREHGCRVTTTTVSKQQFDLAKARVEAAGLTDRVTVLLEDYRDLRGTYDKLVSIEMVEAVGDDYLDEYFQVCASRLGSNGAFLLQAITIPDGHYETSLRTVDFVKKHVFPGCQIPSLARLARAWSGTDFGLTSLEDLTYDYALTLKAWRERFLEQRSHVLSMGYDETFARYWEFYLAYCEAGFLERRTGDVQLLLARAGSRAMPFLPGVTRG